jgi:hypothetical protein
MDEVHPSDKKSAGALDLVHRVGIAEQPVVLVRLLYDSGIEERIHGNIAGHDASPEVGGMAATVSRDDDADR